MKLEKQCMNKAMHEQKKLSEEIETIKNRNNTAEE